MFNLFDSYDFKLLLKTDVKYVEGQNKCIVDIIQCYDQHD